MALGFFADLLPSPASCYIECQQPATRRNPAVNTLLYEVNPGEASTFLCDATGIINKGPKTGWCPASSATRCRPAVECRTARPKSTTCRSPDRSTTRRLYVDALDNAVVTCHACLTRKLVLTPARKLFPRCHLHWCSREAREQMARRWPAQCGPHSSDPGIGILIDDRKGQDGDYAFAVGNVISCCRQVADILLHSQSNRVTEAVGLLATKVILAHNSVTIQITRFRFCPRQD